MRLTAIFTPARSTVLLVMVVVMAGFLALSREIGINHYCRIVGMPLAIQYEITDTTAGYDYYVASYTLDNTLITAPAYWLFDGRTHEWDYYPAELRLNNHDAEIDELHRIYTTIPIGKETK